MRKSKFYRTNLTKAIVSIAIIFVIAIALITQKKSVNTEAIVGKEELIQSYIEYLSNSGDEVKVENMILTLIEGAGMETEPDVLSIMPLEEAEKQGLLNNISEEMTVAKKERFLVVANQQHKLVVDKFGKGAWEAVTYTLEETEPVDGKLGYQLKSTGEIVSKEVYDKVIRSFWEDVAEKEGITYYDIFLRDGEPAEFMQKKRIDIITDNIEDLPAKLILVSDHQTYRVNLKFDGRTEATDGYKDFHFIVDNRKGEWVVIQGLTWNEPFPEFPTGD